MFAQNLKRIEMKQIIECVPNFSEGRDMAVIKQITDVIESVEGIKLLDVDPGAATNRTVVTFVGEPEPVCNAAFLAVKKASELIDMSKHHGLTHVSVLPMFARSSLFRTSQWNRPLNMHANLLSA